MLRLHQLMFELNTLFLLPTDHLQNQSQTAILTPPMKFDRGSDPDRFFPHDPFAVQAFGFHVSFLLLQFFSDSILTSCSSVIINIIYGCSYLIIISLIKSDNINFSFLTASFVSNNICNKISFLLVNTYLINSLNIISCLSRISSYTLIYFLRFLSTLFLS